VNVIWCGSPTFADESTGQYLGYGGGYPRPSRRDLDEMYKFLDEYEAKVRREAEAEPAAEEVSWIPFLLELRMSVIGPAVCQSQRTALMYFFHLHYALSRFCGST
jgi:hypothetical protein